MIDNLVLGQPHNCTSARETTLQRELLDEIKTSLSAISLNITMAMEMDKIELMVELQVFTHIHDQRAVHRQFIPDTQ